MRQTWLWGLMLVGTLAVAREPLKPIRTPTAALTRIEQLLQSLQQAATRGVAQADAAAAELNKRIEALSRQIKSALENVQRTTTATDPEIRDDVKGSIQDFSGFVKRLDAETFRKVHEQTQELLREADSIQ